nr:MAG TPA: hypothetical protein [Caudoviricetes sp.]
MKLEEQYKLEILKTQMQLQVKGGSMQWPTT